MSLSPYHRVDMISATILTKNSAETIQATLDSCSSFPEVLVFDTGSTDETIQIASRYPNVRVIQAPFQGFGPTHNEAASVASYDWILSIDSDEVLSADLVSEIKGLALDPEKAYSVPRANYFRGRWIRGCAGWHPDRIVRLYHRKKTKFSDDQVHEKIVVDRKDIVCLKQPLLHTPYRSIEGFLTKTQIYSTLFAEQHAGKKKSSLGIALFHAFSAFIKSYFLKRGFLEGKRGLVISIHNAHVTYYKYLKLAWRNNSL